MQGEIKEIKSRYPREQVYLSTLGQVEGLEQLAGVKRVEQNERGYQIQVSEVAAAQEILKTAMAQTTVEHFEIKEPTLNQIFIREVGESNE
ncbi:hypothetical protein D3C75_1225220 [compost metagenome]